MYNYGDLMKNCDPFELNMLTVVSDVSLFTGMSLVISNLPKSPGMIKLEGNHVASKAAGEHARFVDLFFLSHEMSLPAVPFVSKRVTLALIANFR